MILSHIAPMSVAKITGVISFFLGLVFAILYLPIACIAGAVGDSGGLGAAMGIGMLIFFPILYGVMGFVFGGLYAWIYNMAAGRVGGIEVEFTEAVV